MTVASRSAKKLHSPTPYAYNGIAGAQSGFSYGYGRKARVNDRPLTGGMASLAAGEPRDRRGRMITKNDKVEVGSIRQQLTTGNGDGGSTNSAMRRVWREQGLGVGGGDEDEDGGSEGSEDGDGVRFPRVPSSSGHGHHEVVGEDARIYGEDEDESEESDLDLGVPLGMGSGGGAGSTTPTMTNTTTSRSTTTMTARPRPRNQSTTSSHLSEASYNSSYLHPNAATRGGGAPDFTGYAFPVGQPSRRDRRRRHGGMGRGESEEDEEDEDEDYGLPLESLDGRASRSTTASPSHVAGNRI